MDMEKSNHKGRDEEGEEEVVVVSESVEADAGEARVRGARRDRFLPISILVAAVLIGGSLVFASLYHPVSAPAGTAVAPAATGTAPTGPSATTTAAIMALGPRDAILGNANAPVTLIEYGDYQCPFCTRFFSQTQPQVVKNYIDTGKVRMVFRNFPFLGPESTAAAEAAECAESQNKFWPYHDALYQAKVNDEAKGGGENDGALNRTLFLSLAQQVGLNIPEFTNCIDTNKYASLVSQERQTASADGIGSTPSFFVNGTAILGAQPYSAFQSVIDAAIKGS